MTYSLFGKTRAIVLSLLVFASFANTSCDNRQDALALADSGLDGATALVNYYQSLIEDTDVMTGLYVYKFQVFDRPRVAGRNRVIVTRKLTCADLIKGEIAAGDETAMFGETDRLILKCRLDALNTRVKMAKRLKGLYQALKKFSSYDAGAEVETAAKGLGNALNTLPGMPGSNVIPTTIVGGVARDLADWQQSRKINQHAKTIQAALNQIQVLFERESDAYTSIMNDRASISADVAIGLLKHKMVVPWNLFNGVPELFGLAWIADTNKRPLEDCGDPNSPGFPPKSECEKVVNFVRWKEEKVTSNYEQATENMAATLEALDETHVDFINGQRPSLARFQQALERTLFYLDEIQKLKSAHAS